MDYASPEVQLLGLLTTLLIGVIQIAAAVIFIRGKAPGPWIMLIGAIGGFIGTAFPQTLHAMENFAAKYSGAIFEITAEVQTLMYYTIWNWLALASGFVFAIGLLITALSRRAQARRSADLESILSQSAISSPHVRH